MLAGVMASEWDEATNEQQYRTNYLKIPQFTFDRISYQITTYISNKKFNF